MLIKGHFLSNFFSSTLTSSTYYHCIKFQSLPFSPRSHQDPEGYNSERMLSIGSFGLCLNLYHILLRFIFLEKHSNNSSIKNKYFIIYFLLISFFFFFYSLFKKYHGKLSNSVYMYKISWSCAFFLKYKYIRSYESKTL